MHALIFIPQVFSPAKVIFAGAGVLLSVSTFLDPIVIAGSPDILGSQAAKDVRVSQDALVDVFERVENFFKRLETYTEVPPTAAMTDMIVKIMVEVLDILAISTKEIREGRTSTYMIPAGDSEVVSDHFLIFSPEKYLKKLAGRTDLEDALKRLDKLTQEEARMAAAQLLKIAHNIENKITERRLCALSGILTHSESLCDQMGRRQERRQMMPRLFCNKQLAR